MDKLIDQIRDAVRKVMGLIARGLNAATGGKLSPNVITVIGLLAHLPIAYLIASQQFVWAAGLLVVFGLFDALDGALARVQKRQSARGMFLDSVTDRIKEVIIYIGIGYSFVATNQPYFAVWALAACGASVIISYVNAWGEVALGSADARKPHQQNKTFRNGILTYDLRIFLLIVGLAFDRLSVVIIGISLLAFLTILQRITLVLRRLG